MLAHVVAWLAALVLAPAAPAPVAGTVGEDAYASRALGGSVPFALYLPPGYEQASARYPVIYFLHGLPASPFAYGAVVLALHHLESFSVVESWSGCFRPTDPGGKYELDLGSQAANARARPKTFVRSLREAFRRRPTFFAFYVGSRDTRFKQDNVSLAAALDAARVPHLFRVYRGAHEQSLWTAHARAWVGLALDHLAPAQR